MKLCLFTLLICILCSFPAFAREATLSLASPSLADLGELDRDDLEALEELTDRDFIDLFFDYMNSMGGPAENDMETEDASQDEPEDIIPLVRTLSRSVVGSEDFVNAVRFDVTIGGDDLTLLFPASDYGAFYVDSAGNLWNISDSVVQGLVVDGSFDPYQDEGKLIYLEPCLGNNFHDNHDGGSPNYIRNYYWTSGSYDRLTYTTQYVEILVDKVYYPVRTEDILQYVLIFILGSGVIVLWLSKFKRY